MSETRETTPEFQENEPEAPQNDQYEAENIQVLKGLKNSVLIENPDAPNFL